MTERSSSNIVFVSDAQLERIGRGLLARDLPAVEWTHAAHFAATFWLLTSSGLPVEDVMPGLIRAYNEATGGVNSDTAGYHHTITLASLRAARAWLATRTSVPLHAALNELLAHELGRSNWILRYWSRSRLFSIEARRGWVEPDLAPLPF